MILRSISSHTGPTERFRQIHCVEKPSISEDTTIYVLKFAIFARWSFIISNHRKKSKQKSPLGDGESECTTFLTEPAQRGSGKIHYIDKPLILEDIKI